MSEERQSLRHHIYWLTTVGGNDFLLDQLDYICRSNADNDWICRMLDQLLIVSRNAETGRCYSSWQLQHLLSELPWTFCQDDVYDMWTHILRTVYSACIIYSFNVSRVPTSFVCVWCARDLFVSFMHIIHSHCCIDIVRWHCTVCNYSKIIKQKTRLFEAHTHTRTHTYIHLSLLPTYETSLGFLSYVCIHQAFLFSA